MLGIVSAPVVVLLYVQTSEEVPENLLGRASNLYDSFLVFCSPVGAVKVKQDQEWVLC